MFKYANLEDIMKEIYNLNLSKAKYFVDIPTKIIKQSDRFFSKFDC